MILISGEALIDLIPDPAKEATYDALLGGSPFNVAIGLARLTAPTTFVSRLSTDPNGEKLAAALARVESLSDPASFLGTMVLLGVPVALLAGVDWARDRRRSVLVVVAMLGGALAVAVAYPGTMAVVHLARSHVWLLLAGGCAGLAVVAGRRAQASEN